MISVLSVGIIGLVNLRKRRQIHSGCWFFLKNEELHPLIYDKRGKYKDEYDLYKILIALGIIDREFNIRSFLKLSDLALDNEVKECDCKELLRKFNHLMEQLGVVPFDESMLPKGVPITL